MEQLRIILLGTNGWFDSESGSTISVLIEHPDWYLVLDAGFGIHKIDRYCTTKKPAFLFLSHFHLDHIVGIHTLPKLWMFSELTMLVGSGGREILESIQRAPFTVPIDHVPYAVRVAELPGEAAVLPFTATVLPMTHSVPTMGLRIEIGGRTISYCPDTGYCQNAVTLSRNADLMLAECAYKPGESYEGWPHLNPETAARMADEAGARKLVLVHFDASRYTDRTSREQAQFTAQEIFPHAIAGFDGMEFRV